MTNRSHIPFQIFWQKCGLIPPLSMERIRAGRNSEVHRISNPNGHWVLKKYHQHLQDKRDRLGTEFGFLTYLKNQDVTVVPRPIGMDHELHSALYTFITGRRPVAILSTHITQAAQFIKTINLARNGADAHALPMAADACVSWRAHLELVASRIDRLLGVSPNQELEIQVHRFVSDHLRPMWLRLQANLMKVLASSKINLPLPTDDRIISPSDFGFHNVLESQDELFFLDFEYAGWDDPAKLICDFICQPELPVTRAQGQQFMEELMTEMDLRKTLKQRVKLLLPLHRLKWCCILLNEFKLEDRSRRLHAGLGSDGLLEEQLSKAKSYFNTHFSA